MSELATDHAEPRLPLPEVPPLEERWAALAEAANAVAALAGENFDEAGLALAIEQAAWWRRERAGEHLADLSAVMQFGLSALLTIRERGTDVRPAAGALLYEFNEAGRALRTVVAPAA